MRCMTAGALLRAARRRHGLTQRQLAIRARTSQAAISRIERGLVSPTVDTLAELLRLMNEELMLDATAIDWGHDVTLIRENLARKVDDRIDYAADIADFVRRNRGTAAA
jgi:transcriptional regulator with XRE-family HTH domain